MVSVRVGLVARRVLIVDAPWGLVGNSRGVVRPPVSLGTRPGALVCRESFKASAAHRLVADRVGMGAIACANVDTPVVIVEACALMAANAGDMVSAACVLAGNTVNDAYVPMHAVSRRMIAAEESSMPGLGTGVCDDVSYGAAGIGLERASAPALGAAPRAMLVGMRVAS